MDYNHVVASGISIVLFLTCLKFNVCFFDIINTLLKVVKEVQKVVFQRHPYAGGTNSCFLKVYLHWRHKQLLFKGIPTLEAQTVAF